jgi:hypothetical protein
MAPILLELEFKREIPLVPSFLMEPLVTEDALLARARSAFAAPVVAEVGSALKLHPCMEVG